MVNKFDCKRSSMSTLIFVKVIHRNLITFKYLHVIPKYSYTHNKDHTHNLINSFTFTNTMLRVSKTRMVKKLTSDLNNLDIFGDAFSTNDVTESPFHSEFHFRSLWKGHTVGSNRRRDRQEVTFQNICTWPILHKTLNLEYIYPTLFYFTTWTHHHHHREE